MTPQEVFDKVVARLRDGTGCAVTDTGICVYLTPNGCRCVVGIFIPDGHPGLHFVGDMDRLIVAHPDLAEGPIGRNVNLLRLLQMVHDSPISWSGNHLGRRGERALMVVARQHDLVYTPAKAQSPDAELPIDN